MEDTRGKEEQPEWCSRSESNSKTWIKKEIWKLRGSRRGRDRGNYSLRLGNENAKHILLNCIETEQQEIEF
jgi:hypothetical protein